MCMQIRKEKQERKIQGKVLYKERLKIWGKECWEGLWIYRGPLLFASCQEYRSIKSREYEELSRKSSTHP